MSTYFHPTERDRTVRNVDDLARAKITRCPDFVGFLAICSQDESKRTLKLLGFLLNRSESLDDVLFEGGSFHVRKVKRTSLTKKAREFLESTAEFVAVKHPIYNQEKDQEQLFSDIAAEVQIMRFESLKQHANIVDFLGVFYFDAGEDNVILPCLVLEYADYGSLKTYQQLGYATQHDDKIDILLDTCKGLDALHSVGIVHGDLNPSNLLVCKHASRKFIVKITDFGFSFTSEEHQRIGGTDFWDAPEANEKLDRRYCFQLDIYAFGLLTFSVMRNGATYFDSLTEGNKTEAARALRKTGILATFSQFKLLQLLEDSGLPVLVICRILMFCLQPDPSLRFSGVERIIVLLNAVRQSLVIPNHEEPEFISATKACDMRDKMITRLSDLCRKYFRRFEAAKRPLSLLREVQNMIQQRIAKANTLYFGHLTSEIPSVQVPIFHSHMRVLSCELLGLSLQVEGSLEGQKPSERYGSKLRADDFDGLGSE